MNENRFPFKHSTYTNQSSDDSSYTYPLLWFTDKKRKSRLGKHGRTRTLLQDISNQNEQNAKNSPDTTSEQEKKENNDFPSIFHRPEQVIPDHRNTGSNIQSSMFPTHIISNINLFRSPPNMLTVQEGSTLKPTDLSKMLSRKSSNMFMDLNEVLVETEEPSPKDIVCDELDSVQSSEASQDTVIDQFQSPVDLTKDTANKENAPVATGYLMEIYPEQQSSRFRLNEINSRESQNVAQPIKFLEEKQIEIFKQPEMVPVQNGNLKQDFQFEVPLPVIKAKSSEQTLAHVTVKGKLYKVLSVLGSGGSSIVYQVLHPENNETLAVKRVMLSEIDEAIAEGYLDEVRLLETLQNSEFIIKMHDHELVYNNGKKYMYVVMEKGDTDLSELIRNISKTKKLSIFMILYFWHEMLSAVNEIHNAGIIHSDLKPANFLLVKGRLKLIDFGIASSIQGDVTSVYKDVFTGTLNYMSPEAVQFVNCASGLGYRITYKTDVWSLGCILYNLIYSRLPFQHLKRKLDKMQAIVDPNVQVDFPKMKGVPSSLMNALKSCLNKNPKKRPSVSQLLQVSYCGN